MIKKIQLASLLSASLLLSGCLEQPEYLKSINANELNSVMQNKDIFLVDVHTPKVAHIKGTDTFIPYNQVENFQSSLPADKDTPIYVYCVGGPMGVTAAKSLHDLGYTEIYNLTGGSIAWKNAGFAFE